MVQGEIRKAVLNGASDMTRPTQPARPGGVEHPNAVAAKEAEEKILELLKAGPLRMGEIAEATAARRTTTGERLRRLRQRGLAGPVGGGAWAATA